MKSFINDQWCARLIRLLIVVGGCALGSGVFAAATPYREPLPNFDSREKPPAGAPPKPARQKAREALRARLSEVNIDVDDITGAPKFIRSRRGFLSGRNGSGGAISPAAAAAIPASDPHRAVKAFLNEHAALFGHDSKRLEAAKIKRDSLAAHSGMRTVVWQQQVDNIPVFEAVLQANLTGKGELINVASNFVPDPDAAANSGVPNRATAEAAPAISARQAVAVAAASIKEKVAATDVTPLSDQPQGADKLEYFSAPGLNDVSARQVWLPMNETTMRLCWEVILSSKARGEMFLALVDAQSGEVQVRQGLTNYISNASYRVYTSDSPSPFSPSLTSPSPAQPPLVARTLVTTPALDTVASPNGWINDGVNETLGNNVDAHLDVNADNVADLPRPHGSPNRVFDFPLDLTEDPTTYRAATVTQLFYWCNFFHDRLYTLGFNEAAGNFQTNNFGRGGSGNDAVQADAQDGSGTDNANFSTPPDGSPGRMQMYVFTGPSPRRDGDLDAEVILHEYAHGLSNRLVGGGVGISQLATRGMGEGWSDYYAMSLLAEPSDDVDAVYAYGGYVTRNFHGLTQNYYYGIRRYPYSTDMTKNPLTFKDIDPSKASSHPGVPVSPILGGGSADEVHNQGEVWCVTLLEARANLIHKHGFAGNELMLQLVTDGMKLSPANPNFLQARDAIIQADLVKTGGANSGELWAAFAKRGMGASAIAPSSSTTTGVQESFDVPDPLIVTPLAGIASKGQVGGPFAPAMQTYTLSNTGSNSINWTATSTAPWLQVSHPGGTLAPGALTKVTVTYDPSASLLSQGLYNDTVVFTNLNSTRSQTRAVSLGVGQTDYFTEFFDTSTNDVKNQMFLFVPDGSPSYYSAFRDAATSFPTNTTTGATTLAQGDDTSILVTLTGGKTVSLYGQSYSSFYVGSNGYITFGSSDTTYITSLAAHFNKPRISALFDDLFPSASAVKWKQTTDRVAVTWQSVPKYGGTTLNSFQIEMFFNGQIRITYLGITDPTGLVGLSRGLGVPASFVESDFTSYGPSATSLLVTLPSSATETAGTLANQGIVKLSAVSGSNVTVTLASNSPGDVSVPDTVTIPAGLTSGTFPLTVQDNSVLDGSRNVRVTASAPGYSSGSGLIVINDNETASLAISAPATAAESSGTVQGTVSVSSPAVGAIGVTMSSSTTTALQVPPTVVIPAGQTSATFPISIIDDSKINGTHPATITAHVENWTDGSATVNILDNENTNLTLTMPSSSIEAAGTLANAGTVSIAGTLPANLTVSLSSNDTTEVTVPSTATITAGQTSAAFNVTIIDDTAIDGSQTAAVTASASGFTSGTASIIVKDNEVHHFNVSNVTGPISAGTPFALTITAINVEGTAITNYSKTINLSATGNSGSIAITPTTAGGFVNGVWNGSVTINTIGSNIRITASDGVTGSGVGNAFDVQLGPLDHFVWNAIAPSQIIGAPIPVTITAKDAGNNTVPGFSGTASITGRINQPTNSTIVISEVDTGGSDAIEFINVSGSAQNLSNWTVSIYDSTTWPAPTATFTIPSGTTCAANQAFLLRENSTSPGTFPTFYLGSNISWVNSTTGNPVAILLRNASGTIVDFFCAVDATPASITSPAAIPVGQWSGSPVTANPTETLTYQRQGITDQNTSADWTATTPNPGTLNTGMTLPFIAGITPVPVSPATTTAFLNGVWSGDVTVPQAAAGMYLHAAESSGRIGDTNLFNVVGSGVLDVSPAGPLSFSRVLNGAVTPTSQTFTVANTGNGAMNWAASKSANWLTLSGTGGTLASGSSAQVTASINSFGLALDVGSYSSTLTFTNASNGNGNTTRTVNFTVLLNAPTLSPEPPYTSGTGNTISWSVVGSADTYEAQCSIEPTFATPLTSGLISGTSNTFAPLADGTLYYYRVRGHHPGTGTLGVWSSVVSSTQDDKAPVVAITAPLVTLHPSLALQGTASDASGIASLTVNGVATTTFDAFAHWTGPTVALAEGANSWTVVATDNATPPHTTTTILQTLYLADADNNGLPDAWEASHNLNPGQPGYGADGDAEPDGILNLLEYALNLDPQTPDTSGLPTIGKAVNPADGKLYLTFSYRRLINGGGINYIVETSSDLIHWAPAGNSAEEIAAPTPVGDGITEVETVRIKPSLDTPGLTMKAVRLRVTSQ